ncbi:MAG: type II toxin-antitoxin system MqsA family antitoxin [Selenomonadaceae bacterium]|nr:type II toxin-antitoxin system MqsA family antitoxin [Selenomonadaceae bacterium]
MCMYCKGKDFFESTTTHVVNYKNCLIIIKNVPCVECEQCGEKFYTDEVADILDKIIIAAKNFSQEISVIDYKTAA